MKGWGVAPLVKYFPGKKEVWWHLSVIFSIQNAAAGGSEIQGYPGPYNEFKTILNDRERLPVLKAKTEKKLKLILKMLVRGHKYLANISEKVECASLVSCV